ncbi:MAG TPA: pantoate--beta-alanine ligase [Gammaproteobacteria bacterium]|nr:pantoate--beta-alanine ligase [Gammaproteobacteria bacterium]
MLTIIDVQTLRAQLMEWRRQEARIALVPTMGNLHAGHMSLIEQARSRAPRVVVSIFVNPMQFDRVEDLATYPRTLEEDCRKLRELDTDIVFTPAAKAVYPHDMKNITRVEVPGLSSILEGTSRPGHFTGVATVVAKLLNITQPNIAMFGEKDYQQLLIIRRMVADLNLPVDIVGLPTVREPNGLAMSSRNRQLTAEERTQASGLYAVLKCISDRIRGGERAYIDLEQQARCDLIGQGFRPDYFSVRRASDLASPAVCDQNLVVVAAAWLGRVRLIDNIRLH